MPTETIYPVCVDCYLFAANGPDDFMSAERVQGTSDRANGPYCFASFGQCDG
jgi:hypothetical protein